MSDIYIPWLCSNQNLYLLDSARGYNEIEFKDFFGHKVKDQNSSMEEISIIMRSDDQATIIVAAYSVNSELEGGFTMFTIFVAQGNLASLQFKQPISENSGLSGIKDKLSQLTGKTSNAVVHELTACASEELNNSITYFEMDVRVINQGSVVSHSDKKIPLLCLSCDKQVAFGISWVQDANSRVSDSAIVTGRENRSPSDILGVLAGVASNQMTGSAVLKSTPRDRTRQREGSEVFSIFAFVFSPPFAPLGSFVLPVGRTPKKLLASPTYPNVVLLGTENSLMILYFEQFSDPESGQGVKFTLVREIEITGPKVLDFTLIRNFILAKNENNEIIELDFSAEL